MAEKLTMKALSSELETLRARVRGMELEFEQKLENMLEKATDKLKSRLEKAEHTSKPRSGGGVDAETRMRLIARAAYLRAEQRGFIGGNSEQDWLDAEIEIDSLLLEDLPEKPASGRGRRKARQSTSRRV